MVPILQNICHLPYDNISQYKISQYVNETQTQLQDDVIHTLVV